MDFIDYQSFFVLLHLFPHMSVTWSKCLLQFSEEKVKVHTLQVWQGMTGCLAQDGMGRVLNACSEVETTQNKYKVI